MDDDQIAVLYAKLSYPTAAKFRATLAKRGVKISIKEAQEIASRSGQRQVLAPAQQYPGRIVSPDLNARWAADLISYVSQPAAVEGRTYRYVLVVQDIFSRKIWTEALQTKADTTPAFERILDRVYQETAHKRVQGKTNAFVFPEDMRKPKEVNCDRGQEFAGRRFTDMAERRGFNVRYKSNKNDFSTLDRAISTLKEILTRRTVTIGNGNWAQELKEATESYNELPHEHLQGVDPNQVASNKDVIFSLQEDAGNGFAHNDAVVRKRIAKLEAAGAHREPVDVKVARSFKPRYQETIKVGPPANMKRALPVNPESTRVAFPAYTAGGSAQVDEQKREILQEWVEYLEIELLTTDNQTIVTLTRKMKQLPGFSRDLIAAKCTFRKFVKLFPGTFTVVGNRVRLA